MYEEVAINLDSSDDTVETTVIHMETGSGLFMLENIDYENTQLRIPRFHGNDNLATLPRWCTAWAVKSKVILVPLCLRYKHVYLRKTAFSASQNCGSCLALHRHGLAIQSLQRKLNHWDCASSCGVEKSIRFVFRHESMAS